MIAAMDATEPEDVTAIFRRFDENMDGTIERSELEEVLKSLDSQEWTDARINALLGAADVSCGGRVRYEEFLKWLYSDDVDLEIFHADPESKTCEGPVRRALFYCLSDREPLLVPLPQRMSVRCVSSGSHFAVALAEDGSVWRLGDDVQSPLGWSQVADESCCAGRLQRVVIAGDSGGVIGVTQDDEAFALQPDRWQPEYIAMLGGSFLANKDAVKLPVLSYRRICQVVGDLDCSEWLVARSWEGQVWALGRHAARIAARGPQYTASSRQTGQRPDSGCSGDGETALHEGHAILWEVILPAPCKQVACVSKHCLALLTDGSVHIFGGDGNQYLADGQEEVDRSSSSIIAIRVEELDSKGVVRIAAGAQHSTALSRSGELFTWGTCELFRGGLYSKDSLQDSYFGELCRPTKPASKEDKELDNWEYDPSPATARLYSDLAGTTAVDVICSGMGNSFAVLADGRLVVWGVSSEEVAGKEWRDGRVLGVHPMRYPYVVLAELPEDSIRLLLEKQLQSMSAALEAHRSALGAIRRWLEAELGECLRGTPEEQWVALAPKPELRRELRRRINKESSSWLGAKPFAKPQIMTSSVPGANEPACIRQRVALLEELGDGPQALINGWEALAAQQSELEGLANDENLEGAAMT